jgi:hypothetical protein
MPVLLIKEIMHLPSSLTRKKMVLGLKREMFLTRTHTTPEE